MVLKRLMLFEEGSGATKDGRYAAYSFPLSELVLGLIYPISCGNRMLGKFLIFGLLCQLLSMP